MREITVLSKEGCHLCERAVSVLQDLSTSGKFELKIVNITRDGSLEEYLLRIPVILLDGKIMFEADQIALPDDCLRNLSELISGL